jgi:hypothetical protein
VAGFPADNRATPVALAFPMNSAQLGAFEEESPMEELIARIIAKAGVDENTARAAVRIILTFLYQQGDSGKVTELVAKIPGAAEYVESGDEDSAASLGGLGGLMGGATMEVLGKLQALGLGMGQIQGVTQETVGFAREKAGDAVVNDIVASIPGLSQFV